MANVGLMRDQARMQRLMSFSAKAAISALLLYLSLGRVNLASIGERLGGLDLRWMTLILFILCVQMALLALRWREIVVACGAKLPLATALSYTFSGQFFSQVLPSTIGGDAVRIWLLARSGAGWPTASYSVLIDRVVGVSILAVLVVACLPWTFNIIHDPIARATLTLIGFGALVGALVFLALGIRQLRVMERWSLTRHLATASCIAWRLCRSVTGAHVVALSFVIHLMTAMIAWGVAMAAHAAIDFVYVLFLILPVMLIATIPVSIAGWGVRESAMVFAFSYAGLAESDGLIVSILFGVVNLAIGVIGGIVWVASGYRRRSVKNIETASLAHSLSS
jgi:glycosyltransferase 2 family protein